MEVLPNMLLVIIIQQYVLVSNQYVVHIKRMQYYMSIIS